LLSREQRQQQKKGRLVPMQSIFLFLSAYAYAYASPLSMAHPSNFFIFSDYSKHLSIFAHLRIKKGRALESLKWAKVYSLESWNFKETS
jgi:hypothetical protein